MQDSCPTCGRPSAMSTAPPTRAPCPWSLPPPTASRPVPWTTTSPPPCPPPSPVPRPSPRRPSLPPHPYWRPPLPLFLRLPPLLRPLLPLRQSLHPSPSPRSSRG